MNNPAVSLIIPVYNGGNHFKNCVKSLFEIKYPIEKLQIVLVDDGSTDDTFLWLRKQSLPPYMVIVHHRENRGRAAARNSGIMQAAGDILIFMDGDMRIDPDCVQAHVNALNRDSVVAVAGKMTPDPHLPRTRLQRYLFEYSKRGAKQFGEHFPIGFQFLLTGNMSLKRSALEAAEMFDENMFGYGGEDTLFAFRIWKAFPQGIRYCDSAVTLDQQTYSLDDMLEKTYHYGKHNLPRLIADYPEMISPLRAEFVTGNSLKKRFSDVICNPLFSTVGKFKYRFMPYPLSNWLIRFLLICALKKGYKERGK